MARATRAPRGRLALAVSVAVALLLGLPTAVDAGAGDYVALGDSYTAGPGIPVPEEPYGCHRSTNNYPHVLARGLGVPLRDASCSGADTGDMTAPQPVWPGPNPPQLDRLEATTSLVTLQIGGNDIGFAEILQRCFSAVPVGTPCQDHYVVAGRDELSERIAATAPKVRGTIDAIRRRAPGATVVVLGYPAILPDAGPGCWPTMPVTPADVDYLRARHKELNAMLATVASGAGVRYVDVYTPSIGHDACQLPVVRWVEPAVPASPAAPVHPNLFGMVGVASILAAAVGSG